MSSLILVRILIILEVGEAFEIIEGSVDWSVEYRDLDQGFWIFQSSSRKFETAGISGFNTGNICVKLILNNNQI